KDIKNDITSTVTVVEDDTKNKIKKENYVIDENSIVYYYVSDNISGICRFIEDYENLDMSENRVEQKKQLKRFIILNFNEIYNFKLNNEFNYFDLNEKFNYPKSIETELKGMKGTNCMDKLLGSLYDQYFLAEEYESNVQILEGKYVNTVN